MPPGHARFFRPLKRSVPAKPGRRLLEVLSPRWAPRGEKSMACLIVGCCVSPYFFALVFAVLVAFTTLAGAAFLAAAFFGAAFFATFFTAAFLAAAGFLAAAFLAAGFLAAAFLAAGFLATGFLAAAFFTAGFLAAAFLAAGFFAADFLAVAMVRLSSSSVGSGCPVKACRNASTNKSLFVACRRLFTCRWVRKSESRRRTCSGIETVILRTALAF